ncbi:MAG: hypothetical protein HY865_24885 [Chloroflexi bacterium]|nr:hypothetical protein [Chloroflexota bacterium]
MSTGKRLLRCSLSNAAIVAAANLGVDVEPVIFTPIGYLADRLGTKLVDRWLIRCVTNIGKVERESDFILSNWQIYLLNSQFLVTTYLAA